MKKILEFFVLLSIYEGLWVAISFLERLVTHLLLTGGVIGSLIWLHPYAQLDVRTSTQTTWFALNASPLLEWDMLKNLFIMSILSGIYSALLPGLYLTAQAMRQHGRLHQGIYYAAALLLPLGTLIYAHINGDALMIAGAFHKVVTTVLVALACFWLFKKILVYLRFAMKVDAP